MKGKKQLIRISIITIILMLILTLINKSQASILGTLAVTGIAAALVYAMQLFVVVIAAAAQLLGWAVAGFNQDQDNIPILAEVIFNKSKNTNANFFPQIFSTEQSDAVATITQNIGKYYYIIRNLSIAIILFILLYIGIRMLISTVAEDEAKYKTMLKNWVVSLAMVFVLHYIIIITFFINNSIVDALYKTMGEPSSISYGKLALNAIVPFAGWPEAIIYISLQTSTLVFILMYIKRIITLAFLIIIAPLITITYSIDKIGDGKSQALDTWLKEFVFTVMIQPFHCIIYIVFVETAFKLIGGGIGNEIIAVMTVFFLLKAEGIVKKIFGIQADSMQNAVAMGAVATGMLSNLLKSGTKSSAGTANRGKMPVMTNNASKVTNEPSNSKSMPTDESTSSSSTKTSSSKSASSNTSKSSNASTSSSTPKSSSTPTPSSTSTPAKKAKSHPVLDEVVKHYARKGGAKNVISTVAKGAASVAGFAAGATIGDANAGITLGMTAGNFASGIGDKYEDMSNKKQLEANQRTFAGAYEDYAREYRNEHGADIEDSEILRSAEELYNSGGLNASKYAADFYEQMDQLKTSAEISGYDDGMDYIKESIRKTAAGEIKPNKDYTPKMYNN